MQKSIKIRFISQKCILRDSPMKKVRLLSVLALLGLLVVSCAALSSLQYSDEQIAEFDNVTAQLNTPEKVDRWLRDNFSYDYEKLALIRSRIHTRGQIHSQLAHTPIETFYKKEGVCIDAANFAAYCLKKAGYKVRAPLVKRHGKGHMVCAVKVEDEWLIVGNTRNFEPQGPWTSYKELLFFVQHGRPEEVYYGYRKGW